MLYLVAVNHIQLELFCNVRGFVASPWHFSSNDCQKNTPAFISKFKWAP